MSTLLTAKDITLHYNSKTYLDELTFTLNQGDIIGLVGKNGCGKTSLLRILAGVQDYDGGKIEIKTRARVGYLPQDFEFDTSLTIEQTLINASGWIRDLIEEYERLTQKEISQANSHLERSERSSVDESKNTTANYLVATQQPLDRGNKPKELKANFETQDQKLNSPYLGGGSKADGGNVVVDLNKNTEQQKHDILTEISDHYGWDLENHIDMLCKQFEVENRNKLISECSGGQQRRVALVCALIGFPSVLILDEPTNHLDLATIENLENLIKGYNGAVLIVSHDRYFLDNIANKMWELHSGKFFVHDGNYSKYLENKAIRSEIENSKNWKKQQYLKRELEWVRQGVKARGTKDKGRMKRFYETKDESGLEKDLSINLILPEPKETGARVLEMENIYLENHGQWIAHNFTFSFQPGQKIGIIGNNGVGKSTFLKLMMGEYTKERIRFNTDVKDFNEANTTTANYLVATQQPLDRGNNQNGLKSNLNEKGLSKISPYLGGGSKADGVNINGESVNKELSLKGTVKVGINTEYLYFDQQKVGLNRENSPFEELTETNEQMMFGNKLISTHRYLQNWLFDKTKRNTSIKHLSGGEKSRLMLAKILAHGGNFLILDEPTNDLDLDTLRVLEENLEVFPGTVAIVSHDRYFLNRVCDYIFAFEGNGAITISTGNYDDYIGKKMNPMLVKSYREMIKKQRVIKDEIEKNKKAKIKKIESDIAVVEKKLTELQAQFDDPDFYLKDPNRATKVHRMITERERELDKLMTAWTTFAEAGVVKDEILGNKE
jgi:ATPase subunit of ABC transporter with duplicated ATPase domains